MTGFIVKLTEDEHWALKRYALDHGYKSKSEAAARIIEKWLEDEHYYEEYENL